jgi:hypothetical protein
MKPILINRCVDVDARLGTATGFVRRRYGTESGREVPEEDTEGIGVASKFQLKHRGMVG